MSNENPFNNSEITTILTVSDFEKAKHFYVDILGAEKIREYGGISLVLKFLGHWLLIVTPGGETDDKPGTQFIPPREPNDISHAFTIRVEHCEKSYLILKKRGANFISPPHDWGYEKRCFFRDPDGHLFEISELLDKG